MRTNHAGVTEVASIRTDKEKYDEGWDRIFAKKEKDVDKIVVDTQQEYKQQILTDKIIEEEYKKLSWTEGWSNYIYFHTGFSCAQDIIKTETKEDIEFLLSMLSPNKCWSGTNFEIEKIQEIKGKYL